MNTNISIYKCSELTEILVRNYQLPVTYQREHLHIYQLGFHVVIGYFQMHGLEWPLKPMPSCTLGRYTRVFLLH